MAFKKSDLIKFDVDSDWVPRYRYQSTLDDNILLNSIVEQVRGLKQKESFPVPMVEIKGHMKGSKMTGVITSIKTFIKRKIGEDATGELSFHVLKDDSGKETGIRIRKRESVS